MLSGQRANAARSGALPVIEFTPSIAITRGARVTGARSSSRCARSLWRNRTTVRAVTRRDHRAVVDRLVRPTVEEDRAVADQDRDHRHVDVGDRGQEQDVLAAEQVGHRLLDLRVQPRVAEQPGPAGVRAPPRQVLGHRRDDLLVEVEPEVVAGRPVGEPLVTDADRRPDLLVDDGVHHGMGALESREVGGGGDPAVEPAVDVASPGLAVRRRLRRGRRPPVVGRRRSSVDEGSPDDRCPWLFPIGPSVGDLYLRTQGIPVARRPVAARRGTRSSSHIELGLRPSVTVGIGASRPRVDPGGTSAQATSIQTSSRCSVPRVMLTRQHPGWSKTIVDRHATPGRSRRTERSRSRPSICVTEPPSSTTTRSGADRASMRRVTSNGSPDGNGDSPANRA